MSTLQFYNSLSKQIEPFRPKDEGKVRIYNCGPTVYKRQHIGNMRRFLFADFLRRSLELAGYEVRDITNITDVGHLTQDEIDAGEDKIEKEAREQKVTPQEIAERQTRLFFDDLKTLNIEPAHRYPKASAHIVHMQKLIGQLLEKGHAYTADSGVYYDVQSFPDYGKLSGNTLANLEAGARVEVRSEKKHPADFALWVVDKDHLQTWDSPWGVGYPGWHIECSAMALEYLGSDIDIHTGGEDNRFPHHENEIAQSEGATGERFVRLWMHNRHLQIGGKKLAKREGEQITLDTIKEKGLSPLSLRLLVFGSHYRTKMDFSWEALEAAQTTIESLKQLLRQLPAGAGTADQAIVDSFRNALADDLNTPEALALFLDYVRHTNTLLAGLASQEELTKAKATLWEMDRVMGILAPLERDLAHETVPAEIQKLAQDREEARANKQFERADDLRQQLELQGYMVEDTPAGPRVIKK
jgi:cysteinyl-tRNA synthetase